MTTRLIIAIAICFAFISYVAGKRSSDKAVAAVQTGGREIFLLNCSSCHHATRDLTGPSIFGVRKRWKNKNLLYQYVRNAPQVIKKDAYSKALFNKWNKTVMTAFPKLTNAEIESIFDYVDGEARKKGLL